MKSHKKKQKKLENKQKINFYKRSMARLLMSIKIYNPKFNFIMKKKKHILLFGVLSIFGCGAIKTTNIVLNENLKTDTSVFKVKNAAFVEGGLKKKIEFGGYKSTKNKTKFRFPKFEVPQLLEIGRTERISFQFTSPEKEVVNVNAILQFPEMEQSIFHGIFGGIFDGLDLMGKFNHAQTIIFHIAYDKDPKKKTFGILEYSNDVVVSTAAKTNYNGVLKSSVEGQYDLEEKFSMKILNKLEGQSSIFNATGSGIYGVEFARNGKVVAAVSFVNGEVYFKNNTLSENEKLILGAAATVLLKKNTQKFKDYLDNQNRSNLDFIF